MEHITPSERDDALSRQADFDRAWRDGALLAPSSTPTFDADDPHPAWFASQRTDARAWKRLICGAYWSHFLTLRSPATASQTYDGAQFSRGVHGYLRSLRERYCLSRGLVAVFMVERGDGQLHAHMLVAGTWQLQPDQLAEHWKPRRNAKARARGRRVAREHTHDQCSQCAPSPSGVQHIPLTSRSIGGHLVPFGSPTDCKVFDPVKGAGWLRYVTKEHTTSTPIDPHAHGLMFNECGGLQLAPRREL